MNRTYFSISLPTWVDQKGFLNDVKDKFSSYIYDQDSLNKFNFVILKIEKFTIMISGSNLTLNFDYRKANVKNLILSMLSIYDQFKETLPKWFKRIYEFKIFSPRIISDELEKQMNGIDYEKTELKDPEYDYTDNDTTIVLTIYSKVEFF